MSYLNLPRITVSGLFEADVNTVNNDVRNYDVEVFEARLQTEQKSTPAGTEYNGWWNPDGSNRFSLLGCTVTGVATDDGQADAADPVLRLTLEGQLDRTAGKIVDLDPQFQFASALWGLRLALMDGEARLVSGSFVPASFRDIFFGRVLDEATGKAVQGSPGASARFTGALYDLVWEPAADAYPALAALKASAAANDGKLQLSLMTYGYSKSGGAKGFLTGSVVGSLGPWLAGEPLTFAPGRRFAISSQDVGGFASASNIGYMNALVTEGGGRLSVDFGAALPMVLKDGVIGLQDLGPITVAVAKTPDTIAANADAIAVAPGVSEGETLAPADYEAIGVLDAYDIAWLKATGGVVDFAVPAAAQALIADHPLLILLPAAPDQIVGIRECLGGMWARADDFVQRIDTAETGWVSSTVSIWAMRWSEPWPGAPLNLSLQPPTPGQGGTDDANEVKPPQTAIPIINIPASAISLPPTATAGANGVAVVTYWASSPGNPRGYLDGQIYVFNYLPDVANLSPVPQIEVIVAHVRDPYVPPAVPSWESDVRPVLVQYSNLYPIMSQGLFSLADFDAVAANARLLHLAFTLPPADPNYMPATRDMSAGKLRMIVDWLASYLPPGSPAGYGAIPPLPVGQPLPGAAPPAAVADAANRLSPAAARAAIKALGPGSDGKTAAIRSLLKAATFGDDEPV